MFFIYSLVVGIIFSSLCYSQEIVTIDDFSSYKDTTQFLNSWSSRVDGYKQTLKDNSYYYYLRPDPFNNNKKCLCSSLRMYPKDFVITDIKPEDIKMVLGDGYIKSIGLYKDYWLNKIRIGNFHKERKEVFMEWDWMASKLPDGALEINGKDDHAIAVYAVIYIGWMRFRVIKYVWSSTDGMGVIPSEITKDENKMVSIASNKNTPMGQWVHVRVNLSEDIKKFLPGRYNDVSIAAIAVLSNSDNVKKPSEACIRDMKLTIQREVQK